VLGPDLYVTVIEHDAPGAAPFTVTVALDPADTGDVTEATLSTRDGVGEGDDRAAVGAPEAGMVGAIRSATVA
jgi:hypothetical protein